MRPRPLTLRRAEDGGQERVARYAGESHGPNPAPSYVHESSRGDDLTVQFVRNRAINRQFHAWFNWEERNANQFFGLFGPPFKQLMVQKVRDSEQLRASIAAFLEVGSERNKLVHQDFASFSLEKTLDEIYELYSTALRFVEGLATYIRDGRPATIAT